jgi:purine-nucleoside phosphorylase
MHAYEGHPLARITFPVRVLKRLGADLLVVTNACGGLNPTYRTGDLMVIDDHINLLGDNPLIGLNDERLGPRFPDMSAPYTPALIDAALAVARRENFVCHRGVYAAVTGPNLETRAEYRFLRIIGADAIGMSTIPEVIVAVHSSMRVLGISVITDMCLPDALEVATVEHILAAARSAEPKLRALILAAVRDAGRS